MSLGQQRQQFIVKRLAGGGFQSGESLGKAMGISRAAVSRYIAQLNALGLEIFSVTGKGYRLANPLALLNADEINRLRGQTIGTLTLKHVVGSTNDEIKSMSLANGDVCIAEAQTAGRGRQGRTWVSPFGASLYLSMAWRFSGGFQAINGLSLAVGVALARTLTQLGVPTPQLKWPNDILFEQKKLAGVLIELEGQINGQCQTIIGIGLNLQLPDKDLGITQPWTDLYTICGRHLDRNLLVATLLDQMVETMTVFERSGLTPLKSEWEGLDAFRDQWVTLTQGRQKIAGKACGIDDGGALLVKTNIGIERVFGGEVSLRG